MNENNPKTLVVLGANGQLGRSIQALEKEYSNYQITFVTRDDCDLSDCALIKVFFNERPFDVFINCAAYTAVDKAESEVDDADTVNHQAVKCLAEIAKKQGAVFIHFSTDYVFNGENFKPYQEEDLTCPQSVYGLTKLKGEQAVALINPKGLIIRTSWVYSEYGANFVKTMLKLGKERKQLSVIFDQIGTPTYALDLAKAVLEILSNPRLTQQKSTFEHYHYSNEGACSWYDFAQAIFELSAIDCQLNPIETKDYPTAAKRPHYSLLNKAKFKRDFGLSIPYWKESLQQCLTNFKA
jgi:dTDP-4-dehydrorhamnose reductase